MNSLLRNTAGKITFRRKRNEEKNFKHRSFPMHGADSDARLWVLRKRMTWNIAIAMKTVLAGSGGIITITGGTVTAISTSGLI